MKLHELTYAEGARTKKRRVGRGPGSGKGKTSGKGHKGQRARSGSGIRRGFEGGQMPLQRRIPKRGFTNIFKKEFEIVNLDGLEMTFDDGAEITIEELKASKLVKHAKDGIKILGRGDLSKKFHVHAHAVSKSAQEKIQAAGGTVTRVDDSE